MVRKGVPEGASVVILRLVCADAAALNKARVLWLGCGTQDFAYKEEKAWMTSLAELADSFPEARGVAVSGLSAEG